MNAIKIARASGLGVAVGFALLAGPAAIASAAPSAPDQNRTVAPTPSAHATSNPWLRASITNALMQDIARLQVKESKLVEIQATEQERIARERAALLASEAKAVKEKAALSVSQQQVYAATQMAFSGIGNLTASNLKTVVNSEKAAAQADRTYVHDQLLADQQKTVLDFQNRMSQQIQEIQLTVQHMEQQRKATVEALNRA